MSYVALRVGSCVTLTHTHHYQGYPNPSTISNAPDESPAQLYTEKTWLAGSILTGVGYGVVLALFWLCLRSLWHRTRVKDADYTRNCFFLGYVCVMFPPGSLFMDSNPQFTQLAFINDRNYPGGPSTWEVEMFSISLDEISNVSFVLADWCSTALMAWRCAIIYRNCGTFLGILFLYQISSPLSSPYYATGTTMNFTFPYFFFELTVNRASLLIDEHPAPRARRLLRGSSTRLLPAMVPTTIQNPKTTSIYSISQPVTGASRDGIIDAMTDGVM
ncbi:hypothetical protein DEU56DRAFT_953015 [Suillus clintonianus]|uniref:uncharacterized protein n=1 Tax=Suillus clintonianus TaxID=1904413 RepID=UPI001B867135|nr:uncharacterized protein DEU56DRAFT_953015 [Suillus clintonianus]KAG2132048.1 hypothetical protein DEU56DRAFT_953015 [Suillus clintonianus]